MTLNIPPQQYTTYLVLNSKDREDYLNTNSNNIVIRFPKIRGQIISYSLKNFVFANTINNIKDSTFQITDSVNTKNISFPGGNYNINSLLSTLKAELDSQSPDTYTLSISNQIIEIQSTSNSFVINPNSQENDFLYSLGFKPQLKNSIGGLIQGDFPVNIKYPKYIMVKIPQFANHIVNKTEKYSFMVPLSCNYDSIIYHEDTEDLYAPDQFIIINLSKLNISLYDEYNNLLDIKNADYTITLKLNAIR